MSASNYSWVCFKCRFATRQPKSARRIPQCLTCGADCFCIGYKVEIPKKNDARGWRVFRDECRARALAEADKKAVERVRDIHAAERRIAHLQALGPNKDRAKEIARLEKIAVR